MHASKNPNYLAKRSVKQVMRELLLTYTKFQDITNCAMVTCVSSQKVIKPPVGKSNAANADKH